MTADYRELVVWQRGMEVVEETYRLSRLLPTDERFALVDQMRRVEVSVPSNIAEGQGRGNGPQFRHFLLIARGSLFELETQLTLCERLTFLTPDHTQRCLGLIDETRRMLNALITRFS